MLATVGAFAAGRGLAVEMAASDEDPFAPALLAAGFAAGPRDRLLMGRLLAVPGFFRRFWLPRADLAGVGLRAWTEAGDYALSEAGAGCQTLTMELREETLHRWLLGRVDLASRLREGTITAYGAPPQVLQGVCAAIPSTPWAYQRLDYI